MMPEGVNSLLNKLLVLEGYSARAAMAAKNQQSPSIPYLIPAACTPFLPQRLGDSVN